MRRPGRLALLFAIIVVLAVSSSAFAQAPAPTRGPNPLLNQLLPMADRIDNFALVADTPVQITVPSGADAVVFSIKGGSFWHRKAAGCAVPTATVTDGTGLEPNPSWRRVKAGDAFCVVTDAASAMLATAWYKLGN